MRGLQVVARLAGAAARAARSGLAARVAGLSASLGDRLREALALEPRLELAGLAGESDRAAPLLPQMQELLDGIVLMGVPKSKVSPSRKRMKHLQHVPEPVNWYKCDRCGEPKRPHRICSAHLDICALSHEDYESRVGGSNSSKTGEAEAPPK